jgi:stage V sporulation protein AB
MPIIARSASILFGFASGAVVAGAVFAFIAAIGVVPRLAQKTNTQTSIRVYETAMLFGGLFGVVSQLVTYNVNIGNALIAFLSACAGIFIGVLAVSLAEVLDMIPILTRRARLQKGMVYFVFAIALGKLAGSLMYSVVPGFHT